MEQNSQARGQNFLSPPSPPSYPPLSSSESLPPPPPSSPYTLSPKRKISSSEPYDSFKKNYGKDNEVNSRAKRLKIQLRKQAAKTATTPSKSPSNLSIAEPLTIGKDKDIDSPLENEPGRVVLSEISPLISANTKFLEIPVEMEAEEPIPPKWEYFTTKRFRNHIQALENSSSTDSSPTNSFLYGMSRLAFKTRDCWDEYLKYIEYLEAKREERLVAGEQWKEMLGEVLSVEEEGLKGLKGLKDEMERMESERVVMERDLDVRVGLKVLDEKEYQSYGSLTSDLTEIHREYHSCSKAHNSLLPTIKDKKALLCHQLDQIESMIRESSTELSRHCEFRERMKETADSSFDEGDWCVDEWCAGKFPRKGKTESPGREG